MSIQVLVVGLVVLGLPPVAAVHVVASVFRSKRRRIGPRRKRKHKRAAAVVLPAARTGDNRDILRLLRRSSQMYMYNRDILRLHLAWRSSGESVT